MKIGFFDSGFGGLSVLNEALYRFDGCEFIYYADIKNVPYGIKNVEEILNLSIKACEFLIKNGVSCIVVACNTATSAAIKELRLKFNIPIIGMEPAVKIALQKYQSKCLLVATQATIKGVKLSNLIQNLKAEHLIDTLALSELVCFAENLEFTTEKIRNYLLDSFLNFNLNDYGSIVLGCTHFNYFKDILREILPENIAFVDGISGTLKRLSDLNPDINKLNGKNVVHYFSSGEKITDTTKIATFLHRLESMKNIR